MANVKWQSRLPFRLTTIWTVTYWLELEIDVDVASFDIYESKDAGEQSN